MREEFFGEEGAAATTPHTNPLLLNHQIEPNRQVEKEVEVEPEAAPAETAAPEAAPEAAPAADAGALPTPESPYPCAAHLSHLLQQAMTMCNAHPDDPSRTQKRARRDGNLHARTGRRRTRRPKSKNATAQALAPVAGDAIPQPTRLSVAPKIS